MQNAYQAWLWEKTAERCVRNLKEHGFDAHSAADRNEAASFLLERIQEYDTFGFGGSDTTRALGLPERLAALGKTVYDHWRTDIDRAEDLEIRLQQGRCDCFLCSANAVSATGEVVNVDGVGNRTNAMSFGPRQVWIVAGINKVTPDLDSALRRIRDVAAPMRARSLGMDTPCAQTGVCSDCNAPQRICRITTILHRKPMLTEIGVLLIRERLGF